MSYPGLQSRRQRGVSAWAGADRIDAPFNKGARNKVRGLFVIVAVLGAMFWTVLPFQPLAAAPVAQTDAQTLHLGEYGAALAEAGDTVVYTVEILEAGAYVITAIDEEAAATFGLTVLAADDEVLYSDIFTTVELTLTPGPLTLEFDASADASLLFVVAGEIGAMTADPAQPGRLYTGSAYTGELINDARYATLMVPPSASPRRVIVYLEGMEGDSFFVTVDGDDINFTILDTDAGNLLTFWSAGGSYELVVEPFERRSTFSLAVFISPPPTLIAVDEVVESSIPAGAEDVIFEIVLDAPYNELSVDLLDDAEGLSIDFVDNLHSPNFGQYSFSEPFLDMVSVPPGVYYVRVYGEVQAEDRPVALVLEGVAGAPIETLTLDEAATGFMEEGAEVVYYQVEILQAGALVAVAIASDTEDTEFDIVAGLQVGSPIWYSFESGSEDVISFVAPVAGTYYVGIESNGTVGDYAVAVSVGDLAPEVLTDGTPAFGVVEASAQGLHRIEITEPGQILTVILVGPTDGDLDLRVGGYDDQGGTLMLEYGFNFGAVEVVSNVLDRAGILEVAVSSYASEPANYVLVARVEDPNQIVGLWAVDAAASSEYGEDDYNALQATGAPDTPQGGDYPTAWTPLEADAGEEYLELAYEFPIYPYAINIHESYNPGAIFAVEVYDLDSEGWVTVWEGEPGPVDEAHRILSIELEEIDFVTDGVRIFLDTAAVSGLNEIDAVELRGRP